MTVLSFLFVLIGTSFVYYLEKRLVNYSTSLQMLRTNMSIVLNILSFSITILQSLSFQTSVSFQNFIIKKQLSVVVNQIFWSTLIPNTLSFLLYRKVLMKRKCNMSHSCNKFSPITLIINILMHNSVR